MKKSKYGKQRGSMVQTYLPMKFYSMKHGTGYSRVIATACIVVALCAAGTVFVMNNGERRVFANDGDIYSTSPFYDAPAAGQPIVAQGLQSGEYGADETRPPEYATDTDINADIYSGGIASSEISGEYEPLAASDNEYVYMSKSGDIVDPEQGIDISDITDENPQGEPLEPDVGIIVPTQAPTQEPTQPQATPQPATPTPAPAQTLAPTQTPAPKPYLAQIEYSGGSVILYQEATKSSKQLTKLQSGKLVTVLEEASEYFKVQSGSSIGYVDSKYITASLKTSYIGKISTDKVSLAIRTTIDEKSEALTWVASGGLVDIIGTRDMWLKVRLGSVTGYMREYDELELINPQYYTAIVSVSGTSLAMMREKPDINSTILRRLPKNSRIRVLELGAEWSKVQFGGQVGYMKSSLLKPFKL